MKFVLNGLSYHNCPLELREGVTLTPHQQRACLEQMQSEQNIGEAVILQTCNRLEFYLYAENNFETGKFCSDAIKSTIGKGDETWNNYSFRITGREVIRHLFKVAAGLDSQALGEDQILAQLKDAYSESVDSAMSKFIFHRLFHQAFRVGKAVRTETGISLGESSVASTAVRLAAGKIHLSNTYVVIIGAGDNACLIAENFIKSPPARLVVANRNRQKAEKISRLFENGRAVGLDKIPEELSRADLVISSTSSRRQLITYPMAQQSLASRKKPLLIIDIAVPRDVDPAVANFECVCLYNIDDLQRKIQANTRKKISHVPGAKQIVDDFTEKFFNWYDSLDVVPVIARLRSKALELARNETQRYAKDFSDEDRGKLNRFAESLAAKILHYPICFLKNGKQNQPHLHQLDAAELINKMFFKDDDNEK